MLNVAKEIIRSGAATVVFLFLFLGGFIAVLLGLLLLAGSYIEGEFLIALTGFTLIPSGVVSIGAAPRVAFAISPIF